MATDQCQRHQRLTGEAAMHCVVEVRPISGFQIREITYRSIQNSHISPPPGIPRAFDPLPCPAGRGEFDGPQRTWGGAFDHNTRRVGNLICCLDVSCRICAHKAARVCLQTLKQLPDPSVIIGEPILNAGRHQVPVCDILFALFHARFSAVEIGGSARSCWRSFQPMGGCLEN